MQQCFEQCSAYGAVHCQGRLDQVAGGSPYAKTTVMATTEGPTLATAWPLARAGVGSQHFVTVTDGDSAHGEPGGKCPSVAEQLAAVLGLDPRVAQAAPPQTAILGPASPGISETGLEHQDTGLALQRQMPAAQPVHVGTPHAGAPQAGVVAPAPSVQAQLAAVQQHSQPLQGGVLVAQAEQLQGQAKVMHSFETQAVQAHMQAVHAAQAQAAMLSMGIGFPVMGMGMQHLGVPGFASAFQGLAAPSLGAPGLPAPGLSRRSSRGASLKDLYKPGQRGRVGGNQPLPQLTPEELTDARALLGAADQRDEPRCRALIASSGFKHINEKGPDGRTALHVCMLRKLPEDLCLSILRRPDFTEVNAVDAFGNTLLIFAASKGMAEFCMAVLEREDFVAINAQDKWGSTALHWAADQDLDSVCEAMLSHPNFVEANRRAWSFAFEDKTALDVAEGRKCHAAAGVIRRHIKQH